jgi:hypothetical protein
VTTSNQSIVVSDKINHQSIITVLNSHRNVTTFKSTDQKAIKLAECALKIMIVFIAKMASTITITVDLFAQQMKYLHDNGFRVLLLNQLGYDPNNNVFDIKIVPLYTSNAATL